MVIILMRNIDNFILAKIKLNLVFKELGKWTNHQWRDYCVNVCVESKNQFHKNSEYIYKNLSNAKQTRKHVNFNSMDTNTLNKSISYSNYMWN